MSFNVAKKTSGFLPPPSSLLTSYEPTRLGDIAG